MPTPARLLASAILVIGLLRHAAHAEKRPLRPDDLWSFREAGDPQVAPDGRWVAYTLTAADRKDDESVSHIWMSPLGGGDAIRLTNGDKSERAPRFSPDGRWLAFLSGREGKKTQVFVLDRRGGEAQKLTDFKASVSSLTWSPDSTRLALVVGDVDPNDGADDDADAGRDKAAKPKTPKPIVIERRQFMRDEEGLLRDQRQHVYVFDMTAKQPTQITRGPYDDDEPAWSPDGRWLAFTSNRTPDPDANQNTDIFVVRAEKGAEPRRLTSNPSADSAPTWTPDGTAIAYVAGGPLADMWYATTHIGLLSVADGSTRDLTPGLDRNVLQPRVTRDGRAVWFLIEEGGSQHLARVPLASPGAIERVAGGERAIASFALGSRGDVVVQESTFDRSPALALVARDGSLHSLTHFDDELLAGLRLGRVERFQSKSGDGTVIDGFLTLPPEAPAGQRLPAILRIHGGPVSQFDTGWHLEWQVLAAHGYAVVAANPRGSSGYGRNFSHAIWADWGNLDFADLMAAVDRVVAMGVADPDRLGVGGWSYGGILTNYVITKTARFKAATSGASEVNFLADYGTDQYQYEWETELGLPWSNVERWMRLSPWSQIEKVKTPTLVLCGTEDLNVPLHESEQLYMALRRLGVPTQLVIYPGEHHDFSVPSHLVDRWERYLRWYDRFLGPPSTSAAAVH